MLSQDRVTIILLAVGQDLYLLDNTSCSVVVSEPWRVSVGSSLHLLAGPSSCCPRVDVYSRDIWPHPDQGQRGEGWAGAGWEGTPPL